MKTTIAQNHGIFSTCLRARVNQILVNKEKYNTFRQILNKNLAILIISLSQGLKRDPAQFFSSITGKA